MCSNVLHGPPLGDVPNSTLGQFFFDSAEKFGDRTCQIDPESDKEETFSSVKTRATRMALALQKMGVTSKDVIATCATVTLDTTIPILASFFLGATVSDIYPKEPKDILIYELSMVTPKVIFVEEAVCDLIEECLKAAKCETIIVVLGENKKYIAFSELVQTQKNEDKFEPTVVDVHDTAIMFFSSGTTGVPKVICHSHYTFLGHTYSLCQRCVKGDAILCLPLFYWISGMWMFTASFIYGGYRIIIDNHSDAQNIFRIIQKYKVTQVLGSPFFISKLLNFEKWQDYDTSSLYSLLVGGTLYSPAQLRRVSDVFQHSNVLFIYGLTETGLASSFNPQTDQIFIKNKIGSCGKLISGVTIKIVDLETKKILGPNQKGELYIKSPTLMKGYYKIDYSDKFDSDGFFKTGDYGYYDEEECLYVVQRIVEMFKYLSHHITPSTIENVLLEHPAVADAIVLVLPKGQTELITAFIVVKKGFNVTGKEIEDFVSRKVSDEEKLREGVVFVEKLPRTPFGKLMRNEFKSSIANKHLS